MPEKEHSAGGQSEREEMTPEEKVFFEMPLKKEPLSKEEQAAIDRELEGDIRQAQQDSQGKTEEPQFSPEFQEISAEKEKMLEQIRNTIQEAETDLKTINNTPELSADPAMGNKIKFALEGLLANLNALRFNIENSYTKGSLADNSETWLHLSGEYDELREQYRKEYDRIFGEETTPTTTTPENLPFSQTEEAIISKHLAERRERETSPPPPIERKTSTEKPPEETEEEKRNELWGQVVDYWLSDLISLPQEEGVERMKAKVEELAGQNELLKEELLRLGLHLITEDETTESQPKPTPEEKKEAEAAEAVAAEAVALAAEVVAEAVEAAAGSEPTPPADAVDIPAELKPVETQEAAPGTPAQERIQKELAGFNITPEQIVQEVPDFNHLSEGRRFLVLENLKQITLGRVQEEAQQKYKISVSEANLAKRIWLGVTREYQITRAEKSSAQEIIHGGIEKHKSILEQLTRGALVGPEAEISPEGKLDIHYLDLNRLGKETETPFSEEEKEKITKFNRLASEYSRLPHEWSLSGGKQELKFQDKYLGFKSLKTEVIQILGKHLNIRYAYELMAETQRQIKLNQLLNSSPEAEKALQKIENQKVLAKFLGDSITERGVSFGLGFAARTFAVGTLGLIGLPIAAAGAAAINSWRRARKVLAEEESAARRGAKTEKTVIRPEGSKGGGAGEKITYEKSKLVKAERLISHIDNLSRKYTQSTDEQEERKILKQLGFFANYAAERIENGTVNFGKSESRFINQYELLESIGIAKAYASSHYGESIDHDVIVKILEKKQDQKEKERTKRIYSDIKRGALYAAGFSIAGMLARELSDYLDLTSPHEAAEIMEPKGKNAARGGFSDSDFEKQIGVDSRDGLNQSEAEKVVGAAKRLKSIGNLKAAEEIERRYGGLVTQDTKKSIGEIFAEKEKVLPRIEKAPKPPLKETGAIPETSPPTEVIKAPTKTWENIIDSEKVGAGSDSVWKSAKEYFLYQTRDQLKAAGFAAPADSKEFGAELDKWAEQQTGNLIKEWTASHGGQSPDIVHDGDKVVIEFDTAHKPHLKILNTEGQEIEPKSFTPLPEKPAEPEEHEHIHETEHEPEKKVPRVIHPMTGEDLGPDPHPELPETPTEVAPTPTPEMPPTELSPADEFKKSWGKVTKEVFGLQGEEGKAKIVKNYVEKVISGEDYTGHKIRGEKLNTFAHMFPMEGMGFAEKTEDIDTSQELAEAIGKFEKQLTETTEVLLKDGFKKMDSETRSFPIVSADGARIFFANPAGNNRWGIFKYNQSGTDFESIKNPNKLFGTREFRVKDIKKLLSY